MVQSSKTGMVGATFCRFGGCSIASGSLLVKDMFYCLDARPSFRNPMP